MFFTSFTTAIPSIATLLAAGFQGGNRKLLGDITHPLPNAQET